LAAPDETEALRRHVTELEQTTMDLRQQLKERQVTIRARA
jgi:hypothetical protein